MRFAIFLAVAALATSVPASALTISANIRTVATGGQASLRFLQPANFPTSIDLAGKAFNIFVVAQPTDDGPFGPPEVIGVFSVQSPDIRPAVAGGISGTALRSGAGSATYILTETSFTFRLIGSQLNNNSRGQIDLIADRNGSTLSNWRGLFSGSAEPRANSPDIPFDFRYDDLAFPIPDGAITVTGLPLGVPEPATWALMIGGFAATGSAMRRRPAGEASISRG